MMSRKCARSSIGLVRFFGVILGAVLGVVLWGGAQAMTPAEAQTSENVASGSEVAGSAVSESAGSGPAGANARAKSAARPARSKANTDVSFEDLLIQGKYHFSDESVITVEQDKVLDALLGVRTDFKDRIRKSATRQ